MKILRNLLLVTAAVGGLSAAYAAGAVSFPLKHAGVADATAWDRPFLKAGYDDDDDEDEGYRRLGYDHERHHGDDDEDDERLRPHRP